MYFKNFDCVLLVFIRAIHDTKLCVNQYEIHIYGILIINKRKGAISFLQLFFCYMTKWPKW